MSVTRQVIFNRFASNIGLPNELVDEIMGFTFYDTATAVQRAIHRANMALIVDRFTTAWISRANTPEMDDLEEHWAINLVPVGAEEDEEPEFDEVQFQATNCRFCGNYKTSAAFWAQGGVGEEFIPEFLDEIWIASIPLCVRCVC